ETIRTFHQPLCAIRWRSTANTDRQSLCDVFRNRKQLRHRIEWLPSKILIKACHDDTFSTVGQPVAYGDQIHIEELPFIDPDHLGTAVNQLQNLGCVFHQLRLDLHVAVANDVVLTIAVLHSRFEDLNTLLGDLSAAQAADQFLALSAEHAPTYHLNPAEIA